MWLLGLNFEVFSLESLLAHVFSKSIALHFVRRCHLRQGQATKIVNLDYAYMIRTYLGTISLFLSGWLRKEGIVIESLRNIVEGPADGNVKLHAWLAALEDTYLQQSQIKPKDTKGCWKFLKVNSAAPAKPI